MDFMVTINHLLSFILILIADSHLSRSVVENILQFFKFFIKNVYANFLKVEIENILIIERQSRRKIQKNIFNILNKYNIPAKVLQEIAEAFQQEYEIRARTSIKLNETFDIHSNILQQVSSEYKIFNLLRAKGFLEPLPFHIGEKSVSKLKENEVVMSMKKIYGKFVTLEHSLKLFLEGYLR